MHLRRRKQLADPRISATTGSGTHNREKSKDKAIVDREKSKDKAIVDAFWIGITLSLVIALIFAIRDMADIDSFLDWLHGNLVTVLTINPDWDDQSIIKNIRGNLTSNVRSVIVQTELESPPLPQNMTPPFIPDFIIYWGYIGSAVYVLKLSTIKMFSKEGFNKIYIPFHIGGLFIGTAVAIVTFFVLVTGGFFGLTIDFSKMSNPAYIQYAYAVVAFFSGYSTRHFISIMSGIIANVFQHDKRKDDNGK